MDVTLQERIAESNLKILKLDVNVFGTLRRIHPVLLWDSESATLVDAGYPGETEMLRQGWKRREFLLARYGESSLHTRTGITLVLYLSF